MQTVNTLSVYTDGGARGNPGPAALGVAIFNQKGESIYQASKYIGETTNNVAEYQGLIEALRWLSENLNLLQPGTINFYLDSNLVVNQMRGSYKVKDPNLKKLFLKAKTLEKTIGSSTGKNNSQIFLQKNPAHNIFYFHVPRKKNILADSLVNQALTRESRKRP